jgi:hypothetical protein
MPNNNGAQPVINAQMAISKSSSRIYTQPAVDNAEPFKLPGIQLNESMRIRRLPSMNRSIYKKNPPN